MGRRRASADLRRAGRRAGRSWPASRRWANAASSSYEPAELLFTENETNTERLAGASNRTPYVKDAFHALPRPWPRSR